MMVTAVIESIALDNVLIYTISTHSLPDKAKGKAFKRKQYSLTITVSTDRLFINAFNPHNWHYHLTSGLTQTQSL